MEIKRTYEHKRFGEIGAVTLIVPDGTWNLNGVDLTETGIRHLANFALQSFQDAYAGADDWAEAVGLFDKKLGRVLEGTIGVREGVTRDPVKAEAIRIATRAVRGDPKWKKAEPADVRAEALRRIAKNPAIMHLAEKYVAEAAAVMVDDIELPEEDGDPVAEDLAAEQAA